MNTELQKIIANDLNDFLRKKLSIESYIAFLFGSRVYGVERFDSDYDLVIVSNGAINGEEYVFHVNGAVYNLHFYTEEHFIDMLNNHKIINLEIFFWHKEYFENQTSIRFVLDKTKLRDEISAKVSNSWVKCKKKIIVENDLLSAKKSLFHSFRILKFGIQLAELGVIEDFSCANTIYKDINEIFESFDPLATRDTWWEQVDNRFRKEHNALSTEFRTLCPKN